MPNDACRKSPMLYDAKQNHLMMPDAKPITPQICLKDFNREIAIQVRDQITF